MRLNWRVMCRVSTNIIFVKLIIRNTFLEQRKGENMNSKSTYHKWCIIYLYVMYFNIFTVYILYFKMLSTQVG